MKKLLYILLIVFSFNNLFAEEDDWRSYGKDPGGGHFSKADDITPKNVKNLKKAWVHRSGDFHEGNKFFFIAVLKIN